MSNILVDNTIENYNSPIEKLQRRKDLFRLIFTRQLLLMCKNADFQTAATSCSIESVRSKTIPTSSSDVVAWIFSLPTKNVCSLVALKFDA